MMRRLTCWILISPRSHQGHRSAWRTSDNKGLADRPKLRPRCHYDQPIRVSTAALLELVRPPLPALTEAAAVWKQQPRGSALAGRTALGAPRVCAVTMRPAHRGRNDGLMIPSSSTDPQPPVAPLGHTVHSLHGVERLDPYAWMRDTSTPDALAYLAAERAYYDAASATLVPFAAELAEEMIARLPQDDVSAPWQLQNYAYFDHRPAGAEYGRLLRTRRDRPADVTAAELVLDPAEFGDGSTFIDVGLRLVSPDERLLAYSLDRTGEEVFELRFRDLATGADLPDQIGRTYYGGAWSADSRHFFYTVHDTAYRPYQLWRHELGTATSSDTLVFEEPDKQYELDVRLTRSGAVIVIRLSNADTAEVWLIDAHRPHDMPTCVVPRRRGIEYDVEHARAGSNDLMLIVTNDGAPEFRVMSAPLREPGREHWAEFMPTCDEERIYQVDAFAGHAVISLHRGGRPLLRVVSLATADGTPLDITPSFPDATIALGICADFQATEIIVAEQSFIEPRRWSTVDLDSGERKIIKQIRIPVHDASRYVSELRHFPAADGTPIPAMIVRRRETPLDGSAPALVYAYGAYEAVVLPEFDEALFSLLDRGVVFVHAHVRGGGEGGRRWWLGGRLANKQNTFSDLIAVADGIDGLVDGARIATRGISAGGLLQGAVFSQRPDRWCLVVAEVPFVDVITTMLDDDIPLTAGEWDEWGDPRRPDDFRWMLAYSPYDNLPAAGTRPDLLVTGALHDPRVSVSEPAKWVAALRASDPEWSPRCQFRCELGEGAHTGPAGRISALRYQAEIAAWVLSRLTGDPQSVRIPAHQ